MQIEFAIDNGNTDTVKRNTHSLPSSQHLMVKHTDTSNTPCLFALVPYELGEAIYNTTDDIVFYPYTRTAPQGNARRIIDPNTGTAHLIACKRINVNDEIVITHRSIVVRSASVTNKHEHKYDEVESISAPKPTPIDNAAKLLVELERRGKTSPATGAEKLKLIDDEH